MTTQTNPPTTILLTESKEPLESGKELGTYLKDLCLRGRRIQSKSELTSKGYDPTAMSFIVSDMRRDGWLDQLGPSWFEPMTLGYQKAYKKVKTALRKQALQKELIRAIFKNQFSWSTISRVLTDLEEEGVIRKAKVLDCVFKTNYNPSVSAILGYKSYSTRKPGYCFVDQIPDTNFAEDELFVEDKKERYDPKAPPKPEPQELVEQDLEFGQYLVF